MDKNSFTQFRRTQIAEMRPYRPEDPLPLNISISEPDTAAGSPKLGDMIARNPKNHNDVWLVAAAYFADNFEPLELGAAAAVGLSIGKETSSRVSSIAGAIMQFEAEGDEGQADFDRLLADAKTLAASCLSQDETPGQDGTFLTRLKRERDDLETRLDKLDAYLRDGAQDASPRHREMLREQSKLMSDLLAVLDERVADLHIDDRSSTVGENVDEG